jgi:hypothetical protein
VPRTASIDAGYFSEANVEAVARWAGSFPSRRIARLVRYDAPTWSAGLSMVVKCGGYHGLLAQIRQDPSSGALVAQDAAIFLFAFSLIDILESFNPSVRALFPPYKYRFTHELYPPCSTSSCPISPCFDVLWS